MRALLSLLCLLTFTAQTFAAFTNGSDRLLANNYMTANQQLASAEVDLKYVLRRSQCHRGWSSVPRPLPDR
jgi:hypothetical protein